MKKYTLLSLFVIAAIVSYSQDSKPTLNYSTVETIIKGCVEYAEANKVKMAIAVYDGSGTLIGYAKMDGVAVAIGKVAQWKGYSAATYGVPTSETASWNVENAPDIATVPGGIIIKSKDGSFIGSIGVSGAASSVDVLCAQAGLKKAGL